LLKLAVLVPVPVHACTQQIILVFVCGTYVPTLAYLWYPVSLFTPLNGAFPYLVCVCHRRKSKKNDYPVADCPLGLKKTVANQSQIFVILSM